MITVRKDGAAGWPWAVGCSRCGEHSAIGVNTPIGWRTWASAMTTAIRHYNWHKGRDRWTA